MRIGERGKEPKGWTQVPDCPWMLIGEDRVAYCSYERTAAPGDEGDKVLDAAWRKSSMVGAVLCTPASCRYWSTPGRRAEVTGAHVTSIP